MNILALADEIEVAYSRRQPIAVPPSARAEALTLDQAYAVEAELARRRRAAGHATVGRKVGFANKALWRVMGLSTVAWASMYDDTVHHAATNETSLSIGRMFSPKIEPEIVIKMGTGLEGVSQTRPRTERAAGAPDEAPPGAGAALEAVEWIALGFEVIDCPFPDWKFQPVDFVAAYGFHAALIVGSPLRIDRGMIPSLAETLPRFTVRLLRNGELAEEGSGRNVLRSPALCLAELASAAASQPGATPLAAGEIISTGTLTTSRPIAPGETWTAEVEGLDLRPLTIHVTP
jgi:2-oxo-3-hexenedioate decarboxylase